MILLDDQGLGPDGHSRLYENPACELEAWSLDELPEIVNRIEEFSNQGLYWVLAASYGLGRLLNGLEARVPAVGRSVGHQETRTPLLKALGFHGYRPLTRSEVLEWLTLGKGCQGSGLGSNAHPSGLILEDHTALQDAYCRAIKWAQAEIAKGTFYQINLTLPLRGHYFGEPTALYATLRQQQQTGFSALWLNFQGDEHLLSLSPELFLRGRAGQVFAQPMKGTCPVSEDPNQSLVENPKNRAENIMIVDLLRNDLGQVCKTGSVTAPQLLSVERVGSLYQMTSQISGTLRDEVGLMDILKASFPCGSVTGAPKRKAMEWIDRLETFERGLYCGALGWLDPPNTPATAAHQTNGSSTRPRLGDFEWNVLIRTLNLRADQSFEMGVGAGITIDSEPQEEWEECLSKAGFLFSAPKTLGLFETIRVEKGEALRLPLHLQRLIHSCRALGIQADRSALESLIKQTLGALVNAGAPMANDPHRLRVSVSAMGKMDVSLHPLGPSPKAEIFWADELLGAGLGVTQRQNPTLRHKVDHRPAYDQAWQRAESLGGFDAIFTNENGEVTEGGRSNIFIKKDGVWLTPPLSSGLLPGIMRAELLASRDWNAKESVIYPADVESAQEIVACNALRGAIKVKLRGDLKE